MNLIWVIILLSSCVSLIFTTPSAILPALLSGATQAITLSIELLAIYSVWLGILGIVNQTKLSHYISKMMSPIIDLLWGKNSMNANARKNLSLSLSTQLLGIGGASVPFGIKAIEEMNDGSEKINDPMVMTIVFACSGIQLLPTTVMGLMTASGSTNASYIIIPTILSSLITTITGIFLVLLIRKIKCIKFDKFCKISIKNHKIQYKRTNLSWVLQFIYCQ